MATGSVLVFVHEGQLKYEGFNTRIMYEENCKSHTSNFRNILILNIYLLPISTIETLQKLSIQKSASRSALDLQAQHVSSQLINMGPDLTCISRSS